MSQLPFIKRFASADVSYPTTVEGEFCWSESLEGIELACPLPTLSADDIVVASFATSDHRLPFRFRLGDRQAEAATGWFGPETSAARPEARIDVPVDYFCPKQSLDSAFLRIELGTHAPPQRFLAVISVRPRIIEAPVPANLPSIDWPLAPISQLDAPARIRTAVCSPTAVAMVVGAEPEATRRGAWHEPSRLFGVWPQNIWIAARSGSAAAIEAASCWNDVLPFLERGPVVASIRFAKGELAGAPLQATAGHMVVVRGVDGAEVIVNDPAAPRATVERRYRLDEFTRAWMTHRGVFYSFDRTMAWRSSR